MKLRQIMNPSPLTVEVGTDLERAREKMLWADVRDLPVVDDNEVVGLLSEHDILAFLSRHPDVGKAIPIVDMAMTSPAPTASPDDSLTEAAARMAAARIGCLPITERRRLLGAVTTSDVLRAEVSDSLAPHPNPLLASDVMTAEPFTVSPDEYLLDAAARMQSARVRHLPIVDATNRVIGIISDRDVRAALGDPTAPFSERKQSLQAKLTHVEHVMTSRVIAVSPTASVSEIGRLFVDHRLAAVPVVDDEDKLLGIISYLDLLRAAL